MNMYKTTETKHLIIEFMLKYGRRPTRTSGSAYERKLGDRLSFYVCKSSGSFDKKFRSYLEKEFPPFDNRKLGKSKLRRKEVSKKAIISFIRKNKRIPTYRASSVLEVRMANKYRVLVSKSSDSYDTSFMKKASKYI